MERLRRAKSMILSCWSSTEKLAAHLAISRQVYLQRLGIVLEAQRCHREQDVFAVDRLALLLLALFGCWLIGRLVSQYNHRERAGGIAARTFAGDERDELAHALLHALLCLLCNLCVLWQRRLHDPCDWSEITYVSIPVIANG